MDLMMNSIFNLLKCIHNLIYKLIKLTIINNKKIFE